MNLNAIAQRVPSVQPTILIVEDEMLLRAMLAEVLRDSGYKIIEACNADEALVILSAELPDLIVTDVRMPGSLDGIAFTAKIRETYLTLPIIITSAHLVHVADPSNGRTHFIAKPYSFETLTELIDRELENS